MGNFFSFPQSRNNSIFFDSLFGKKRAKKTTGTSTSNMFLRTPIYTAPLISEDISLNRVVLEPYSAPLLLEASPLSDEYENPNL